MKGSVILLIVIYGTIKLTKYQTNLLFFPQKLLLIWDQLNIVIAFWSVG